MIRKLTVLLFATVAFAAAQAREKRVVPVNADLRQSFESQAKVAVLAGVGVYPSRSGLSRLRFPSHDVDLLQAELSKQGFKVVALKEQEATRGSIEQALKDAAELIDRGRGTLLFFFSGHGFADKGENYLATFEATSADLAGSGLAVKKVEALLKATGAPRQVMFIDACRTEPGKAVGTRSFERFEASAGLRELLSTKAGRISYEDDQLGSGVFTHFLVRALRGEAAGQDGLITFRDLADFVTDRVSTFGFQHGQMQVPYEAGESSGDFLLAKAGAIDLRVPPTPSEMHREDPATSTSPEVGTANPTTTKRAKVQRATTPAILASPAEKRLTNSPEGVMSLAWAPDGRWFVAGTNRDGVTVWDAQSERIIATLSPQIVDGRYTDVAVSRDGKYIAISTSKYDAVSLFESRTFKLLWQMKVAGIPLGGKHSLAFSPDGRIVVAGTMREGTGGGFGGLSGFDVKTGKVVFENTDIRYPRSADGDQSSPLKFSPTDPAALYVANNALLRGDGATGSKFRIVSPMLKEQLIGSLTFKPQIMTLDISPIDSKVIWDGNGECSVTRDGGMNWTQIGTPCRFLAASQHDAASAYATAASEKGAGHDSVRRTTDYGRTWQTIIEDIAWVSAVRESPTDRRLLIGSMDGIFIFDETLR